MVQTLANRATCSHSHCTDQELLRQFLARADDSAEAAFATLVERHGPIVHGVCRDILGDLHESQDASQAVFLVLSRKARSIRKPESLGSWLHGVALAWRGTQGGRRLGKEPPNNGKAKSSDRV